MKLARIASVSGVLLDAKTLGAFLRREDVLREPPRAASWAPWAWAALALAVGVAVGRML